MVPRRRVATAGAHPGFALIEVLVSLSVVALLASAAYPALQALRQRRDVVHAADLLAASIEMARAVAVARRDAVSLVPLTPASGFGGGWRVVAGEGPHAAALSVVSLQSRCLRIDLAGSGGAHALRLAAVGYSRAERGGFYAATFSVRCGGARRQVRLSALGRLRICTPGRDADCDNADRGGA
ncbi:type IV fimbrial biogenesis protein FimT [Cupriavidus gilardii J11]|uniref:Type II secretion system protein H n=1 Tax=Cupriavidus gilardii J11 TaxID=936133 RepID=A0A562BMF2_9BURK|nr:GspH/FimT family pseudopilin [Cupriavidus gilardii]TWG86251.1 type IV fimbrial biogenesis protein FimT [Cupriavidus gilardii J11]